MNEQGSESSATATAAERGDTVPRWVRNLIRLVALVVLVGATAGLAFARDGGGPDLSKPDAKAAANEAPPMAAYRHEVTLLAAEDARLRAVSLGEAPQVSWVDGTLVLGERAQPYTLGTLVAAGAVTGSGSTYLLLRPVVVRRDASLVIDAPGATLHLTSTPDLITSLVSWGGNITLAGSSGHPLRVVGWDTAAKPPGPDTATPDGRAYVRVKDGTLTVTDVDLSHLGYWSGRTGGLSLTGSSETSAIGLLDHVSISHAHIGLYLAGAQRVRVLNARITDTERHGIEATNGSSDIGLRRVQIHRAGEDGISVSSGSSHVDLQDVRVSRSAGYALAMDGSPLARSMNSAGYGIENYAGLHLVHCTFLDNARGGALVRSLDDITIASKSLIGADGTALDVQGPSHGLTVSDTQLTSSGASGLVVAGGVTQAKVTGSTLRGDTVAARVSGSGIELDDNDIVVGTGHGLDLQGAGARATVARNEFTGRGSGAVHAADGAILTQSDNVTDNWTYRPAAMLWAETHSSAMPLLLVLFLPIFGALFVVRRRRQQHELRRLFEEALVTQGRGRLAAYDPLSGRRTLDLPASRAAAGRSAPAPGDAAVASGAGHRVVSAASSGGGLASLRGRQFGSAREFAIAAVVDAGFPPSQVAQVLHLPTSRVRAWAAEGGSAPATSAPSDVEPVATPPATEPLAGDGTEQDSDTVVPAH